MNFSIDENRLAEVTKSPIGLGSHPTGKGFCVMEAVAYVAGEPWSDTPECACPIISTFLRAFNDGLPSDADRNRLLRPLVAKLVGTRSTPEIERKRGLMATDWLIRVQAPAWLRLAGLVTQAEALASLSEITDMDRFPALRPVLQAIRTDANAAWAAAWAAARAAAWDAAWDAARAAAWDAARAAAGAAAWAAARAAAWDAARAAAGAAARAAAGAAAWAAARAAAWDAAWDAARDAARAAAWDAAKKALAPTVSDLQKSAVALVERMIAAGDES